MPKWKDSELTKQQIKNRDYWKERLEQLENANHDNGVKKWLEIEEQFVLSQAEIQAKINAWAGRLAVNNKVSVSEAKKLLTKNELEEFKWNVNQYIHYGKQNALDGQWLRQLENASAKYHINRLEALKIHTQHAAESLFGNYLDEADHLVRKSYTEGYYQTMFEVQKGHEIGWDIAAIDQRRLQQVISKPWTDDGVNFSDRIWMRKNELTNEIHKQLSQIGIKGKSPVKAIERISKKFKTSKERAQQLILTESAFFYSTSQKECFNELGVEKYEIVATLDESTSEKCQDLDGEVFDMEDYEVNVTAPPFHVNCRSCYVPFFPDDIGERAARGTDGKTYYVDGNTKYKDWVSNSVKEETEDLQTIPKDDIIDNNWVGINHKSDYTKKEAISRLKDEYNINFSDSRKYPINEEIMNNCVGWLDSFNERYNNFMQKNPCKLPTIKCVAASSMKNATGHYIYYPNSTNVVEIALNGEYHSDLDFAKKYVNTCIDSKWHPQNYTTQSTFIHEYGHHVSNSMKNISNNKTWQHDFITECINEFKTTTNYEYDTNVGMSEYVSRYGAVSEAELFAESFAEFFGGENPREFALIFGRKLIEALKGVR